MSNEIQTIRFYDDDLAVALIDDKPYVSVRHVCEVLHLDYSGQLKKLKGEEWATVGQMSTVDSAGKTRNLSMIPVKVLPMWMAGIKTNKVADEIRPKLVRYKLEAADVLARHFMKGPADPYGLADLDANDPINAMLLAAVKTRVKMAEVEAEQKAQRTAIEDIRSRQAFIEDHLDEDPNKGFHTASEFARMHNLLIHQDDLKTIGMAMGKYCREKGIPLHKRKVTNYPAGVNVYPVNVLTMFLTDFQKFATNNKI